MNHHISREELYALVWSEPFKTLAPRFGVSDVALRKTCLRNMVPVPAAGHWAKVKAGKKTTKQLLPPRGLGMPEIVEIGRRKPWWHRPEPENLIDAEIPPPLEFLESIQDLTNRVREVVGKVSLPKNFAKVHRLIAKLLEEDEVRRQKQLASSYPSRWDAPLFESPFERRRLRVLNALFIALEKSGMRPSLRGKDPTEFGVQVGDQYVSFKLDHPGQEQTGYWPASDANRPASDTLRLEISHWQKPDGIPLVWEDKKDELIERYAEDVVVGLIVAGEMQYRHSELSRHEWLVERKAQLQEEARRRKEEEERRERDRRIKAEKARVDRLLGEAAALRQATDIRAYVEMVRTANARSSDPVAHNELDAWASWALAQADQIDPVLSKRFLLPSPESAESLKDS